MDRVLQIVTQPILSMPVFQKERQQVALMLKEKGILYAFELSQNNKIWPIHTSLVGLSSYLTRFSARSAREVSP